MIAPEDRISDERREAGAYWLERCRDVLAACTPPDQRAARIPAGAPDGHDNEPTP